METCKHHEAINEKLKRYDKHCDESDEPKVGYRDRLITAENNIKNIRAGVYKAAVIGGVIGALLGQASPEAVKTIMGWFK